MIRVLSFRTFEVALSNRLSSNASIKGILSIKKFNLKYLSEEPVRIVGHFRDRKTLERLKSHQTFKYRKRSSLLKAARYQ